MALLEIDEFVVNAADFEAAQKGNADALARIKAKLDGEQLYLHAFPVADDEIVISLRQLEAIGALDSIVLHGFTQLSGT